MKKFIFLFVLGIFANHAQAGVFQNFLQDLNLSHLPISAIQVGVDLLGSVQFQPESEMGPAAAFYFPNANEISLNETTKDTQSGGLKHLAQLGPVDAGIVIHELWHSFYWNSFQNQSGSAQDLYRQGFQNRYNNYPTFAHEEIQEEAYALFIQEIARDYLQVYLILSGATPDQRKNLFSNPKFVQLYSQSFTMNSFGYYRGNSGQPVFVNTPILPEERNSILQFFFGGKLTGNLGKDFPQFN